MSQEPVHKWNLAKVAEWLTEKGFDKYCSKFTNQKIDGKVLLLLNETDLKTAPLNITVSTQWINNEFFTPTVWYT